MNHNELSYQPEDGSESLEYVPPSTLGGSIKTEIAETMASRGTFSEDSLLFGQEVDYQTNLELSKFDHDNYRASLVSDFEERNKEFLGSILTSARPGDEILEDKSLLIEVAEGMSADALSELNAEIAIVSSEAPDFWTRNQIQEQAVELHLQRLLASFAKANEHWWQTGVDIAGYFVPDRMWDQSQIEGFDPEIVVQTYRGMSPVQKFIFLNNLAEQTKVALDNNNLKIIDLLQKFSSLEGASELQVERMIDGGELVLLGGPTLIRALGKSVNLLRRTSNTINHASSPEVAGDLTAAALESKEAAKALGIDQTTAVLNGSHFPNAKRLDPLATDNIGSEVIEATSRQSAESTARIRRMGQEVLEKEFVVSPQLVKGEDLIAAHGRSRAALEEELVLIEGTTPIRMGEFDIIKMDNLGFTAQIPYVDSLGEFGRVTHTLNFGVDEVGSFGPKGSLPTFNVAAGFVFSPKYLLNEKGMTKTIGELVESGELRDTVQGRYLKAMGEMYKESIVPITGKLGLISNKKIDGLTPTRRIEAVMETLDEMGTRGHRPTPRELVVDGILTQDRILGPKRIRLTPNEAQVVFNLSEVGDFAYLAENIKIRTSKILNKESFFKFSTHEKYGNQVMGVSKIDTSVENIYDSSKGSIPIRDGAGNLTLTDEAIEAEGKILVKFTDNLSVQVKDTDDQFDQFRYALVREEEFLEIPEYPLPARDFYVTKITPNVKWVIKEHTAGTVDGVANVAKARTRTIHLFDGEKSADAMLAKYNLKAEKNVTYEKLADRQYSLTGEVGETSVGGGTLFTGARATHELKFGIESIRPDRVPAFEAIQRNLQHLSNKLSRTEWRFEMENKWKKTASDVTGRDVTKFDDGLTDIVGNPEKATLDFMRTYIQQQMKIPTKEESIWEGTTRQIADWMEGSSLWAKDWQIPHKEAPINVRKSVMYLSQTDPQAAVRALTFHTLLGWYSPAQIFVQAQNASIVVGLSPKVATKAIAEYPVFRAMIFAPNKKTMQHTLRKLPFSKAAKEDMVEETLAAQRTGYFDSLTNNADMSAALSGMGAGLLKRGAESGLRPYKEGELASRAIAWKVAWKEARLENPTKKFTDEDIANIFTKANDTNLNMNRANQAAFQTNQFTAVGTQFFPVITKWVEKLLPNGSGGWTVEEKLRMLLGQGMLYGAAGVPGGTYILNQVAESLNIDPTQVGKLEMAIYTQGITGLLFGQGELQVADRAALASGLEDTLNNILNEDTSMVKAFFGASATTFGRAADGIQAVLSPMFTEVDWSAEDWGRHVSTLPATLSSFNNAQKAYFMATSQRYYDRKYATILSREFSPTEIIGQAFGLRITEAATFNKAQLSRKNRVEYISKISDTLLLQMNRFAALIDDDPKAARNIAAHVSQIIASHPEGDQSAIRRNIVNAMKAKPKAYKAFLDVINNGLNSQTTMLLQAQIYLHNVE